MVRGLVFLAAIVEDLYLEASSRVMDTVPRASASRA